MQVGAIQTGNDSSVWNRPQLRVRNADEVFGQSVCDWEGSFEEEK